MGFTIYTSLVLQKLLVDEIRKGAIGKLGFFGDIGALAKKGKLYVLDAFSAFGK